MKFFETSTRNLLAAEAAAGVTHHVALSAVGTDRLTESGYFRAKIAQEKLIKESPIPYSIRARLSLTRRLATSVRSWVSGHSFPDDDAQLGETRFKDWLERSASQIPPAAASIAKTI